MGVKGEYKTRGRGVRQINETRTEELRGKSGRYIARVRAILKRIAEEASDNVKRDIEEAEKLLTKIAKETSGGVEPTTQRLEPKSEKNMPIVAELQKDSGNIVTKEMDFSDFTNVEVDCAFKVEITRSDTYRVSLKASEKLINYINVAKSGNTLKISLKPLRFQMRPTPEVKPILEVKPTLEAQITMPSINKLRLSAATTGLVRGFSSQEPFDLILSGASALDIDIEAGETKIEVSGASGVSGNLKIENAEFILSGASITELGGSAKNIILNAWGASRLDLADFATDDTSVHLSGASQATINVNGKLDLDLGGASRLNYTGNAKLRDISLSGASTLSQI